MALKTSDFDYDLPKEMVAQKSVEPRDHSRLMVMDRKTGELEHRKFFEIVEFLRPGDVLVFNNSKVFRARLYGRTGETPVELFLLRPVSSMKSSCVWEALARPGRKLSEGLVIELAAGESARVLCKKDPGVIEVEFGIGLEGVFSFADNHGDIPVPPYVKEIPESLDKYQTVYANEVGSVAAPTAGFHFTEELLEKLARSGIQTEFVTLHVGLGTFMPVKTETLDEHPMHSELVQIDEMTASRIQEAKSQGRRIIAVGTTTVRALEGSFQKSGKIAGFAGDVDIFITPGFEFRIVDGMVTNFHLPKSTLLALVSAFSSRETVLHAYEEAKRNGYRFYSFGDAMFIA